MKLIKKLLFILIISLCIVTKVNANDAIANNWQMYCEDVSIVEGAYTKCYVLAQVQDATIDPRHNIQYVATELKGDSIFLDYIPENGQLEGRIAHGVLNNGKEIKVDNYRDGAAFTNPLFTHTNTPCRGGLGCYDFYADNSSTGNTIKKDTSLSISAEASPDHTNPTLTPIGYWKVYINNNAITPDSGTCANLCLYVDYAVEGGGLSHGLDQDLGAGQCMQLWSISAPRCEYKNGNYYDSNGQVVTKAQYQVSCFPACGIKDGKYYNSNHEQVTEENYRKDCFSCKKIGNTYYDKDGREATKEKYQEDCFPTCKCENNKCYNKSHEEVTEDEYRKDCFSCKKEGNKYYDKDGKETTKTKYQEACFPACKCEDNKCYNKSHEEVTEDEYRKDCFSCKKDGNKYYDKDGKEVTEKEYNKACNPICRCENNQCYNDEGTPVTEEQFQKDCKPKCRYENDKYYDKDGKIVTEKEYIESCACREENGKYYDDKNKSVSKEEYYKKCNPKCRCENKQCYDNNGKPVDDKQYKKMCGCRKENGKFYDFDGNETTEEQWNAKCVPKTGAFIKIIGITALLVVLFGLYNYIKIYKGKKKIYKV